MENNARTTNSNKIIHKYLGGYFVFVLVAMSFLSGLYVGNKQNRTVSPDPLDGEDVQVIGDGRALDIDDLPEYLKHDVDFNLYWKVWNTIKESFVDNTIPETQLFYGSLRGMVDSLDDPYSLFLTPDITQRFTAELQGEFQGIGAEISIRNDILTVIAPLSGTPASKAGLRAGDMILEIDGQDTSGMFLDEAVTKIRGVGGTAVVLTIYREGFSEPKKFEIIRDTIIVNSVVWEVRKDGLGYVKISHFNENTSQLWNE
ncbi:MAG TPA: PDZ domain-containing protein, partial [Patescibacteria group bacterium]|nr:PDZ domain-containing protein [Patescibacteria group bacterium]